jgi:uncharacterized protein (TIGR02996 family)
VSRLVSLLLGHRGGRWVDAEAGFISALTADPSDAATRLVYADWLEERGDPRGAAQRLYVEMKAQGWWIETEIEASRRYNEPPRPGVPLADVVFMSIGDRWGSEESLRKIARLCTLRSLHIEASRLTDAGLAILSPLTELRVLNLRETRITDEGLAALSGLLKLQFLWLNWIPLTGSGLRHLRNLSALEELFLNDTACSTRALRHLRPLRQLKRLTLSCTRVTDRGLSYLGELPELRYVDLTCTAVTEAGAKKLRARRSELEVDLHAD